VISALGVSVQQRVGGYAIGIDKTREPERKMMLMVVMMRMKMR
jgi:hypothetical protein